MVSINKEWKTQEHQLDQLLEMQTSFETDDDRIQTHLMLVETVLRNRSTDHLPVTTKNNRLENLESLISYWKEGQFPKNTFHPHRQPYFIDIYGTACAVGHLLQTSGEETLAQRISLEQNFAYIKELQYPELGNWAIENGFETGELAWIQPCYNYPYFGKCPNSATSPVINNIPGNKINVLKNFSMNGQSLLYMGGDFQMNINGSNVNSIVAYDGINFIDLGIDITGEVFDMITYNNSIVFVGDFQDQQSNASNIIQYTPGSGYVGLQTGAMNGTIKTVEVLECILFVGGDFTAIDGNNFSNLAAYTGMNGWSINNVNGCSAMSTDPITVNGPINDMAIVNGLLAIGGNFTQIGTPINAPLEGLAFYSLNGWTNPIPNITGLLTSVDHLEVGTSNNHLLIAGDNLMGFDFSSMSLVQGGDCIGPIVIPMNSGRVDALIRGSAAYSGIFYVKGNNLFTLLGYATSCGEVGIQVTFDAGGEINDYELFDSPMFGGEFTNLSMMQSISGGYCFEHTYFYPSADNTPDSGAAYKFCWLDYNFPVELAKFDAKLVNDIQVELSWQTHSEENSSHYEIERSTTGEENSFVKVGEQTAAGTSIEVINYFFTDRITFQSKYLYYRLKMIDLDGKFQYSDTEVIKLNQIDIPDIQVYPNPAIDEISLAAELTQAGTTQIQVFSLEGKLVKNIEYTATENRMRTKFDISDLAAGLYLLQITNEENRLVTKFQKVNN